MTDSLAGTFQYTNPLTIHYGAGCVDGLLEAELGRLGVKRVFLVSTRSVAANPALGGSLARIIHRRSEARAREKHRPV
jgi:hypothetical protein